MIDTKSNVRVAKPIEVSVLYKTIDDVLSAAEEDPLASLARWEPSWVNMTLTLPV